MILKYKITDGSFCCVFLLLVCISGNGLECSKPCFRPWPSGLSARHKPRDNQKQSEGTEPRTATVPYTVHEGFSQTGGGASRQQPVIMEIVRCDDSSMLIACFFFSFRVAATPADSSTPHVRRNEEVLHRRSINAMKQLCAEIKCFVVCSWSDELRLTPRM